MSSHISLEYSTSSTERRNGRLEHRRPHVGVGRVALLSTRPASGAMSSRFRPYLARILDWALVSQTAIKRCAVRYSRRRSGSVYEHSTLWSNTDSMSKLAPSLARLLAFRPTGHRRTSRRVARRGSLLSTRLVERLDRSRSCLHLARIPVHSLSSADRPAGRVALPSTRLV
jgi:hypothetical protein